MSRAAELKATYARLPGEPTEEEFLANWDAAHPGDSGAVVSGGARRAWTEEDGDDAESAWWDALFAERTLGAREARALLEGFDVCWYADGTRVVMVDRDSGTDDDQVADFAGFRGAVPEDYAEEVSPEHARSNDTQCDQQAAAIAAAGPRALRAVVKLTSELAELRRQLGAALAALQGSR